MRFALIALLTSLPMTAMADTQFSCDLVGKDKALSLTASDSARQVIAGKPNLSIGGDGFTPMLAVPEGDGSSGAVNLNLIGKLSGNGPKGARLQISADNTARLTYTGPKRSVIEFTGTCPGAADWARKAAGS
jgi:hypothetical protein